MLPRWTLAVALLGAGCARGERPLEVAGPPASLEVVEQEPSALRTVPTAAVTGRAAADYQPFEVARRTPEAISGHARRIGVATFDLALRLRTPDLTQYPCTSCHVAGEIVVTPGRIDDAHRDIQPVHPAETGATCGTCHSADDVEMLELLSGERVQLDQAYLMCAQCHFAQVDAWGGGGHGKRLDGWQGRRVVMGCADCHDPHNPSLEPRSPFAGPPLPLGNR
jgi:hypothetical protein